MVDLHKNIATTLAPAGKVELEFPESNASLPVITISEIDNGAGAVYENVEYTSIITFQIDVWAKTRQQCEEIASQVDDLMTAQGFIRVTGRALKDPSGLQRKTLRYRIEVFNKKG